MEFTDTERVILWLALEGASGIWEAAWDIKSQGLVTEDVAVAQAMTDTKKLLGLGLIELYSQQEVADDETLVADGDAFGILDNVVNWTPPGGDRSRPMYLLAGTDAAAELLGYPKPGN